MAVEVASTMTGGYDVVFVSPARRAAETAEILAPGAEATVEGGLAADPGPEGLADVVRDLISLLPDGGRALAVSHTPLIEKAVLGLIGRPIEPLAECEGVVV